MALWDWVTGLLYYLGLYKKKGKLFFLGLDNAGKTTLLHAIKGDGNVPAITSLSTTQQIWKNYISDVEGIVFVIDVNDRARFLEAKEELDSVLTDQEVAHVPVMILGNKIDIPGAASEDEIRHHFGLHGMSTGKGNVSRKELPGRPLELFMCSVLKRQGYGEGFRWLAQYINECQALIGLLPERGILHRCTCGQVHYVHSCVHRCTCGHVHYVHSSTSEIIST